MNLDQCLNQITEMAADASLTLLERRLGRFLPVLQSLPPTREAAYLISQLVAVSYCRDMLELVTEGGDAADGARIQLANQNRALEKVQARIDELSKPH